MTSYRLSNMAKKQRGKAASKAKPSEAVITAELLGPCLSSSDDEAPDEVTFEDSKAAALQNIKLALDSARREKEQLKEKRRRRQEIFKEQKKRKLLPDEVLQEIDAASPEVQDETQEKESEDKDESKNKRELKQKRRKLDEKYTVTVVSKDSLASVQQKVAEDFIQSRLYGPGSRRTTNNELLSLQNKSGRNKSAAVQFVKDDWASKEKAKSAKIKKKWIHKQKLQS